MASGAIFPKNVINTSGALEHLHCEIPHYITHSFHRLSYVVSSRTLFPSASNSMPTNYTRNKLVSTRYCACILSFMQFTRYRLAHTRIAYRDRCGKNVCITKPSATTTSTISTAHSQRRQQKPLHSKRNEMDDNKTREKKSSEFYFEKGFIKRVSSHILHRSLRTHTELFSCRSI